MVDSTSYSRVDAVAKVAIAANETLNIILNFILIEKYISKN